MTKVPPISQDVTRQTTNGKVQPALREAISGRIACRVYRTFLCPDPDRQHDSVQQ
jgi:hypothetical protein